MNSHSRWRPIETAPKDGTMVVCWAPGWHPTFLMWKTNPRIVSAHAENEVLDMDENYFGDPVEYDDYDLAKKDGMPTHWHPLDEVPHENL